MKFKFLIGCFICLVFSFTTCDHLGLDTMLKKNNKKNNALPIEMVWIPAGTFTMGDDSDDSYYTYNSSPAHQVTLTKGFYMGKYPVTRGQYRAVMGNFHRYGDDDTAKGEKEEWRPVDVGWANPILFCNKLSILEGLTPFYDVSYGGPDMHGNYYITQVQIISGSTGYRLPTEAQWEYACRAGTTTAYNTGNSISNSLAWFNYDGNYKKNENISSREVGLKLPNAWGLYDMHGNVWELCWDWLGDYTSEAKTDPIGETSYRGIRGGSFRSHSFDLRSSYRTYGSGYDIGFRVIRP